MEKYLVSCEPKPLDRCGLGVVGWRKFILLTILSLNMGFVSTSFSMKRPNPEAHKDAGTKRSKKESCRPGNNNMADFVFNREIGGPRQLGADKIYKLIKNNDRIDVVVALVGYGNCVLEKIQSFLKHNSKSDSEFKEDAKEFIKRWKNFFESEYIQDSLFDDLDLDLASSLDINWGPIYILQPLKKYTKIIKDDFGKILKDQFEELKRICLEGMVNIVSLYFSIKRLSFKGNNLKHVPWYIFKLKFLFNNEENSKYWDLFYNQFPVSLSEDYSEDMRKNYRENVKKLFDRLKFLDETLKKEQAGFGSFYMADQYDTWIEGDI